jgi:hypothetical protein
MLLGDNRVLPQHIIPTNLWEQFFQNNQHKPFTPDCRQCAAQMVITTMVMTTTTSTKLVSAFLRTKPKASPPGAEQAQQLQKDKPLAYNNTLHMTQTTHNKAAAAFGMQKSLLVCGEAPHDVHIHRLAGV